MTEPASGHTTETPPPVPFSRPRRRLCRHPRDRRIGGVASGVASFLGLDTSVVRVLFVIVAAVTGGAAIFAYLLAWVLLPEPGDPETRLEARLRNHDFVVLAVGAVVLLVLFGAANSIFDGGWGWGWHRLLTPMALVAAGVVLLLHLDRDQDRHAPDVGDAIPPSDPVEPARPTDWLDSTDPTTVIGSPGTVTDDPVTHPTAQWWAAPPPPPVRTRRPSPVLRNLTLGAAFVFAAAATLLDAAGAFDVSASFVLSGMLLIVAAGILASAWWGRRRGLLLAAVLLSIALAVSWIPGLSLAGGIGDRVERPLAVSDVPKAYRLGVGDYQIDLTKLTLPTNRTLQLTAGLGAGRLTINVPRSAELDLSGHISAGAVRVDDRSVGLSGVDVHVRHRLPAGSDAPRIAVRLDAAFADVEVQRVP